MLKLRDIRPRNINQRSILVNNPMRDKRPHTKMVILRPSPLKRAPRENNSPKILINRLEQRPSRSMVQTSSASILIASIPINSSILPSRPSTSAAESFNGEDITFFHALVGPRLDEGDLLVPVDFVAEDVVAGDAADGFDGEGLAVDLYFVALHYFLHYLAHVVHSGVDAGFLGDY